MPPMTRVVASVVALLTIMARAPLRAQDRRGGSPAPAFQVPSNLYLLSGAGSRVTSPSFYPDSSSGAPDYRYEGAAVGALVFASGGWYVSGFCDGSDCDSERLKVVLGGAAIGALFGLLIGGMIPKD